MTTGLIVLFLSYSMSSRCFSIIQECSCLELKIKNLKKTVRCNKKNKFSLSIHFKNKY